MTKTKANDFSVKTPYLTKDIWDEVSAEFSEICPIRLVQFLRMNSILIEEGDYNELYHLSNCCCRPEGWKYLVGDRITPPSIHRIELCDVLATDGYDVFYIHVKHKFDGGAARDLCSQVRACIKSLWGSLTNLTSNSMVEKFYDAIAQGKELRESTKIDNHKRMAANELDAIASTKEEFIRDLLADDKMHHVCLSPSVGPQSRFKDLADCQLGATFKNDELIIPFEDLVEANILKENGRISQSFFNITGEEEFIKRIQGVNQRDSIKEMEKCFKKIKTKLFGHEKHNALLATNTFVAKNELVELYDHFKKYNRVHGSKDPIKLHLIDLGRTNDKIKTKNNVGKKRLSTESAPNAVKKIKTEASSIFN